MKVILLKNIQKLGKKNDIKRVADGYARNYLLPKNLAVLATSTELENLEKIKEEEAKQAEQELLRFQEIAGQLDGMEIEIFTKVNEDNNLFGSITNVNIADKLKELNFDVNKDQIKLKEPIKEIGEYDINIEFPHNLEVKIKLIVTALEE